MGLKLRALLTIPSLQETSEWQELEASSDINYIHRVRILASTKQARYPGHRATPATPAPRYPGDPATPAPRETGTRASLVPVGFQSNQESTSRRFRERDPTSKCQAESDREGHPLPSCDLHMRTQADKYTWNTHLCLYSYRHIHMQNQANSC